jgi:hypothetical protein
MEPHLGGCKDTPSDWKASSITLVVVEKCHKNWKNWESWTGSPVTCGSAVATAGSLDALCSPMMTHLKIIERGVDQHSYRPDSLVMLWLTGKL